MNIFSVPHDGPFQSHLCFYCFLVCIDFYSNKHLCKQYFHAKFLILSGTHMLPPALPLNLAGKVLKMSLL